MTHIIDSIEIENVDFVLYPSYNQRCSLNYLSVGRRNKRNLLKKDII